MSAPPDVDGRRIGARAGAGGSTPARERILEAAYQLFSAHGTRAVGIDRILEEAGVARMTLYRTFASKEALVMEFLGRREERWTRRWLQDEVEARSSDPAERLLAIFDVFHDWFQTDTFEGCSFINVMLEHGDRASRVRQAAVGHLATIREFLSGLASDAGISEPDEFARSWHILMKGSIVAAAEGDRAAARRARAIGALLLRDARGTDRPARASANGRLAA